MIDAKTLAETWDSCADRLLLIARSFGGPAEDAVQEAFVALASQSRLPDDPMAWLVRVTRNQLMTWQRSGSRRQKRELAVSQANWFEAEVLRVEQRIDAHAVSSALIAMASPQREVIVMHLWGEMSFEAIGRVLDMSRASAHRSFQQGITTLKNKFEMKSEPPSMRIYHE